MSILDQRRLFGRQVPDLPPTEAQQAELMRCTFLEHGNGAWRLQHSPIARRFADEDQDDAKLLEHYMGELRENFYRATHANDVIDMWTEFWKLDRALEERSLGPINSLARGSFSP